MSVEAWYFVSLCLMATKKKLPKDSNQLAKIIVDTATQQSNEQKVADEAKAAAAALGRLGGLKGGPARAKALSAKKRSEIAKKAAAARWHKAKK